MFTFGSETLDSSLANMGIALGVFAVIIGLIVLVGRLRGSRTIALDATLAITGLWIVLSAAGLVIFVVKAFTVNWAELDGASLVSVPWPADLPCTHDENGTSAMLRCGSESLSDFTVANASLGLRLLAAAAQISGLALATTPVVMLWLICVNTVRGRGFSRTITRALTGGAIAVLVFGIASDLLQGIAATTALREVFAPDDYAWYPSVYQLTVTPLPFAGALMLAALAAVFRHGLRLQQERDALQRENEMLADDNRGLV
ncbi:hypothetical protein [Microbacterium foliorum]|uniref:hypothetical protein n=1 Tax=Microbacterium foliorum TaxID=104336 RepID=UPI001DB13EA2|nr:hypothetical protein [Microbacterium foliorum]CAH0255038.1 hypothetical protein SRABI03_03310 [Microbacterium foliorum]CAH0255528.1 hypothetical protein SRABI44_03265 [Microbacterium foliorum]